MELQRPLILFTTFISASAGLFAAQGCYALAGDGRKAQLPALITSVVIMAIGGIAVFFHLTHPDRLLNGFGHITSGITQELIAIVSMFVVMVTSSCTYGAARKTRRNGLLGLLFLFPWCWLWSWDIRT